uniref:SMP-30/Gluconolactonase/LRE-like region domain-containing protein n=1 Tax=Anabas testudineus TaxID=64144 RepID=A0AAQ6ISP2_ANATE
MEMMSSLKVEPVVKFSALIGEGPIWEESEQMLLFVDIAGQKIHRWSPTTNQIESVETGDTVGFAVPRRKGGYVAGVGLSIVNVDWSTRTMTSLLKVDQDKPNNRLNDGKVDPVGRLLAGTMGKEQRPAEVDKQQGSLFSVNSDLNVTKHLSQVDISNGLDWSLDMKTFFYIDSLSLTVDAFDYDITTGQLGNCIYTTVMCIYTAARVYNYTTLKYITAKVFSCCHCQGNRRVVYHMREKEGLPDGLTVDADGRLWVACYNGGRVINIDPGTGVCLQTVYLPVMKTTSCCFGGLDYSDLYVTSASLGLGQSEIRHQPLAGHTFRVRGLGVKGRPSNSFSG